jgi:hypothetical protein
MVHHQFMDNHRTVQLFLPGFGPARGRLFVESKDIYDVALVPLK